MFKDLDKGILHIGGNYYLTEQSSYLAFLENLRDHGYELKKASQLSIDEESSEFYKAQWSAHHRVYQKHKCNACGKLYGLHYKIDQQSVFRCHDCKAVMYEKMPHSSVLRFYFEKEDMSNRHPDVRMKVQRWDAEEGFLYLFKDSIAAGNHTTDEGARNTLERYSDWYTTLWEHNNELIRVRYIDGMPKASDIKFGTVEGGHTRNFSTVSVWDDKEYAEDAFPFEYGFYIFEAWKWAPLAVTPALPRHIMHSLAEKMSRDFYPSVRPVFEVEMQESVYQYLAHLTVSNLGELWREASDPLLNQSLLTAMVSVNAFFAEHILDAEIFFPVTAAEAQKIEEYENRTTPKRITLEPGDMQSFDSLEGITTP